MYIVRMADAPVVAYEGTIPGYASTKPAKGQKIDPDSTNVVRYVGYLDTKHANALSNVGGRKLYDYRYAFNGFAAQLTAEAAARLQADGAVLSVEPAREVPLDTATTPKFLGLTDPGNGLWTARGVKGENVIIGIIDSGIWPESKSFSDRPGGRLAYRHVPGFHGRCASAETTDGSWDANKCNKKLVAAQFYCAGRGCDTVSEDEYLSPRDFNGHGTHTASTAGGNEGVATTGNAALFGSVNGIAPRARIAAYKACWSNNGAASCNTVDSVAAIDRAVADGVDVMNYSISGTRTNYLDAVEVAFLFASNAGVFVATSAGNSGPSSATVAHISPWLASVAAGTHNRTTTATVTLGNAATFTGASLTNAAGPASLVYAGAVKLPSADPTEASLCFPGTLDAASVTGRIVLCDRGINARIEKSATVQAAGGVGMILRNMSRASLNADSHSVPTVHVNETDGAAIKAYVDSVASATAALSQATMSLTAPAPDVAPFSSRGPSIAGGGDLLKPDFMAPGVDVLAAVSPAGSGGRHFDILSGTSMSSPHIAGIGALLTEAHDDWSPAAMRSAIATTADALSRAGLDVPLSVGSGHVRPNLAIDPGLVYDAGPNDYFAFLKGQGLCCGAITGLAAIDASDLNQPSIAVGDLTGMQTVTRRVTNVGGAAATYAASVVPPTGFTVTVSPSTLLLQPGETKSFQASISRIDAPLNAFRSGALTWTDGSHEIRSPIVVRPIAIAAPVQVTGTGVSGSTTFPIRTGYTGSLSYATRGLIPATTTAATVTDDPTDDFLTENPDGNQGITVHSLTVPAGTVYARIALFDEFTDGNDDLDLYVYRVDAATLTLVGTSVGVTSAEQVNLVNPLAGTYRIYVHGFETDGPDAAYTLHTWVLGSTDAGNMSVSGPSAVSGGAGTVNLSWNGLGGGTKYLGQVAYQEGGITHATTVVRIDT